MVIVNGVNQLKELLQKEGYIRDINQMKYMKPVNIQNGGRECKLTRCKIINVNNLLIKLIFQFGFSSC